MTSVTEGKFVKFLTFPTVDNENFNPAGSPEFPILVLVRGTCHVSNSAYSGYPEL
jgi:hypothetical protein